MKELTRHEKAAMKAREIAAKSEKAAKAAKAKALAARKVRYACPEDGTFFDKERLNADKED